MFLWPVSPVEIDWSVMDNHSAELLFFSTSLGPVPGVSLQKTRWERQILHTFNLIISHILSSQPWVALYLWRLLTLSAGTDSFLTLWQLIMMFKCHILTLCCCLCKIFVTYAHFLQIMPFPNKHKEQQPKAKRLCKAESGLNAHDKYIKNARRPFTHNQRQDCPWSFKG